MCFQKSVSRVELHEFESPLYWPENAFAQPGKTIAFGTTGKTIAFGTALAPNGCPQNHTQ